MKFFVLLSLCGLLVSALLYKIILAAAERREIRLAQLVTFFFVVIWIAIDIVLWPALMRLTMTTAVLNGITHIILLLVIATGENVLQTSRPRTMAEFAAIVDDHRHQLECEAHITPPGPKA